ncbi:hypothetical protein ACMEZ4_01775 [Bifidobacterium adolescentis]|uniref:hypothetical protein n=1 Tax=Bifidobacterium adolescentis TaxID=1680 RepID=UPI003BB58989
MFNPSIDYPCAIADKSPDGCRKALRWCLDYANDEQRLTLWMPQKKTLNENEFLRNLSLQSGVNTIYGRNDHIFNADGPVLAMYPQVEDLGIIVGSRGITALCVVQWVDSFKIWIQETSAEVLTQRNSDDDSCSNDDEVFLTPEIVKELQYVDSTVNCNNAISGGYEKKIVIRQLLKLHDEGIVLPSDAMMEWVASHGWSKKNCKKLKEYAEKINDGIRPRYDA